eukprot:GEMP01077930.1.p1 GENE.GEMP01077930.1~~GEMP01077930.1.p1  ORF type:complete len:119 (+),score=0.08 GEMP01077930.1:372-728(+)
MVYEPIVILFYRGLQRFTENNWTPFGTQYPPEKKHTCWVNDPWISINVCSKQQQKWKDLVCSACELTLLYRQQQTTHNLSHSKIGPLQRAYSILHKYAKLGRHRKRQLGTDFTRNTKK